MYIARTNILFRIKEFFSKKTDAEKERFFKKHYGCVAYYKLRINIIIDVEENFLNIYKYLYVKEFIIT